MRSDLGSGLGIVGILQSTFERLKTPRTVRWLLLGAALVFAGGLVVSLRAFPLTPGDLRLAPLVVLVLISAPGTITLNAAETELSAALTGRRFGWRESFRIAVLSTAANALPLPGGPMVRITALKLAGSSLAAGSAATLAVAVLWLGLSFLYAGCWLIVPHPTVGLSFTIGGFVLFLGSFLAVWRIGNRWDLAVTTVFLKSATVALGLLRMALALMALKIPVTFDEISVFSVSCVAGSAVSVVPAGLGVNEAVAALLAGLVTIPPSGAFLGAALSRLAGLVVLLPVSLGLGMMGGHPAGDGDEAGGSMR